MRIKDSRRKLKPGEVRKVSRHGTGKVSGSSKKLKPSTIKKQDAANRATPHELDMMEARRRRIEHTSRNPSLGGKLFEAIRPPTLDTSKSPIHSLQKNSEKYFIAGGLDRKPSGIGKAQKNPPKDFNEFVNRLKWAGSQMLIGGGKEFVWPAGREIEPAKHQGESIFRVTGAILTPSPADIVALSGVRQLQKSKQGKKIWNKILNRIDVGRSPFKTPEDALEFEALTGPSGITSTQLRDMSKTELQDLARRMEVLLEKYPDWARTQDWTKLDEVHNIPDPFALNDMAVMELDWTDDIYVNFLIENKNKLKPELVIAIISQLPKSKQKQFLEDLKDRPDYVPFIDTTPKPDEVPEIVLPVPDIPDPPIPDPPIPDPPIPDPPTPDPPTPDDPEPPPPDDPEPPKTPPIKLTKDQENKRRALNLKLYNDPGEYHVSYQGGQSFKVKADSFPDAMSKAQRARTPTKRLPKSGSLVKVK